MGTGCYRSVLSINMGIVIEKNSWKYLTAFKVQNTTFKPVINTN